ncbi:MAG TPA: Spy/CpxP family protein refolding chaperone [Stellaceae bacterium]|nr:Spy/CpxP family protein refolding chaperone [Stellaceae bacterium]
MLKLKLMEGAARGLAAVTLLGLSVVANPLLAQTNPAPATQTAQSPDAAKPATHKRASHADRVETRIKQLHAQLQITAAQEPQWNAVAQAMRDDAQAMQSAIAQRRQTRSSATAVDELRSYEQVTETHVAGLQKLIPAFQALYDSMSPEQKKNADAAFRHQGRAGHRTASKTTTQQ